MKFVKKFNPEIEKWLLIIENSSTECNRTRNRAKAIRLSANGFNIDQLASICNVNRDTVGRWIKNWENLSFDSLVDITNSGRKPIINTNQHQTVIDIVNEEPRQLKRALEQIQKQLNISISLDTLKRFLKKNKCFWGRIRKSLKSKRNEEEFKKAQKEIRLLEEAETEGYIDLCYFDESGFSLVPCIPYAWQHIDDKILLPSAKSPAINVLGFINKKNELTPYTVNGSVNSQVVIACFDDFCSSIVKSTVVIIDNAPIHCSNAFLEKIPEWESKGLFLYNLPKYSPELNKIEILWKMIKYYWIPFSAYVNFDSLKEHLDEILINIGKKYLVNFA